MILMVIIFKKLSRPNQRLVSSKNFVGFLLIEIKMWRVLKRLISYYARHESLFQMVSNDHITLTTLKTIPAVDVDSCWICGYPRVARKRPWWKTRVLPPHCDRLCPRWILTMSAVYPHIPAAFSAFFPPRTQLWFTMGRNFRVKRKITLRISNSPTIVPN